MTTEPTPEQLAAEQGVPARGASHYAKGTAANMIRSMAVIVAITLALFFMTGRPNSTTPDSIDVQSVAADRGAQAGQTFSYAEDLPEGWTATSARYSSAEEVLMWNAGYTTPDEEYVSVRQALDPSKEWVDAQTMQGTRGSATTTDDDQRWVRFESEEKDQRSLVDASKGEKQLTTVVTGTGSWEQLETFAEHLAEAKPAASGSAQPSPSG